MGPLLIAMGATFIPAYLAMSRINRNRRRARLMDAPLPKNWQETIDREIAIYKRIPENFMRDLHGYTQILIAEKNFEGCGGIELTEEMKVIVASQAAILLLNRKPTFFPVVDSILIYPGAYVAEQATPLGNQYIKETSVRAGESSTRGTVVLAWDHVSRESRDTSLGRNVILHEFAHQLDQENRSGIGVPILENKEMYAEWAETFNREFSELRHRIEHSRRDVIDPYGATNPAEFFAVATETFFVKSRKLKEKHPSLYDELRRFYKLDPAEWS